MTPRRGLGGCPARASRNARLRAMLHDVVIVGAGPVGTTLALALAAGDADVVVLDERAPGQTLRGDRSLALSYGARLILERLGVWSAVSAVRGAATPIARIDISQAGGFGQMTLAAEEQGIPALGYVVSYRALQSALDAALARTGMVVRHGVAARASAARPAFAAVELEDAGAQPVLARLAAVADGSGAAMAGIVRQRHDYGQVAVIGKLWRAAPHDGVAYERFTPDGTDRAPAGRRSLRIGLDGLSEPGARALRARRCRVPRRARAPFRDPDRRLPAGGRSARIPARP